MGFFRNYSVQTGTNLLDVMEHIEKEYSAPQILLGRSFGGSTVLAGGSSRKDIRGYILWCTPVFLKDTFSTIMPEEYGKLEKGDTHNLSENNRSITIKPNLVQDFNNHDMDTYLQNLKDRPTLIIHGTADDVVKPDNALFTWQANFLMPESIS